MNHSFDVELASEFGIEEAIMIEHLAFWIKKNIANNNNIIDGECWTYNSARAFNELFPYMNPRKIARVLENLEDKKIIKSGNYNKLKHDRTKWYCIVDNNIKDKYKLHINIDKYSFDKMTNGCDKMTNGFVKNVQPIPCINTGINTYKNNHDKELDVFENLFKKFDGINFTKTNQASVKKFLKTMSEKEVIEYLTDTYNALKENENIKSIARAFSAKIKKGDRQVNSKPKVEKTNDPIISVKEIKPIVASKKTLGEKDLPSKDFLTLIKESVSKELRKRTESITEFIKLNSDMDKKKTFDEVKEFASRFGIEV